MSRFSHGEANEKVKLYITSHNVMRECIRSYATTVHYTIINKFSRYKIGSLPQINFQDDHGHLHNYYHL